MTRRALAATWAILCVLLATGGAAAQTTRDTPPATLILQGPPPLSQHRHPPLDPDQLNRLRQARTMRESGLLSRALASARELQSEAPHHPLVLSELAQIHLATGDYAAVERMARPERLSQKDSLLLGRELSLAYERLDRASRAAQVVVEVWVVAPDQHEWASQSLLRLHPVDPQGVTRCLRQGFEPRPARADLAQMLARLEWMNGDMRAMIKALRASDRGGIRPPLRWQFAEELLRASTPHDSAGAIEALLDLAGDTEVDAAYRSPAGRRAWDLLGTRGESHAGASRVVAALDDIPPEMWEMPFLIDVARHLREAGRTEEARKLLQPFGDDAALLPPLAVERALADLRDGPPEAALAPLALAAEVSPEGRFYFAEGLFFAGHVDSAVAQYKEVARDPRGPNAGAALERIYLLEDGRPREALPTFGRAAYAVWRGDRKEALKLADSLYRELPRGELWASAVFLLAAQREAAGDARGALEPLLALADSLPTARLASRALQRAGEIHANRLGDPARAVELYEECLARYPRAWNAPEVRRQLQALRREQRL
jgi:tetratricopeptide (TPR) repeat protein